jgi:hypothetical protein
MKKYKLITILFLTIFLSSFSISKAMNDGIDVNLDVGGCNNNGICEIGEEDMFSCPADCTPAPSSEGSGSIDINNYFKNLTVEVSYNSAVIKWKSSVPTISNFKWGTSPDYKDGVIHNINFLLSHKVEINNLKDGTLYYFNIQAENYFSIANSIENQVFRTLSLPDTTPPGNPTNVKAFSDPSGITISWDNPKEEDFDYIRILRNLDRYYGTPFTGHLVYEGNGKYFTDGNVKENTKYFYSLFSRDRAGNYSSGSLTSLVHNPFGFDNWGKDLGGEEEVSPFNFIFTVVQSSSNYDFKMDDTIALSGDEPIVVKTNYTSKIKNDDIWLTIRDKEMKIMSQYFFSRTRDTDGFIGVTIPSFEKGGKYNVTIYKYEDKEAKIINRGFFKITKVGESNFTNNKWNMIKTFSLWFFIFLILLILLILIRAFLKKRRESK